MILSEGSGHPYFFLFEACPQSLQRVPDLISHGFGRNIQSGGDFGLFEFFYAV
jgi:hypothetical protein